MVRTKRHVRKKQKSKSRKLKGGKYIASGAYGCVFKPAIKCKGDNTRTDGVSKLMEKQEAQKEVHEQVKVDRIDPSFEYHLEPPKICDIGDLDDIEDNIQRCHLVGKDIQSNLSDAALLQLPYGGIELKSAITMVSKQSLEKKIKFIMNMCNLFKGLADFDKNKFAHLDIKPPNILYNPEKERFNFIDFGLSAYYKDIKYDRYFLFTSKYFVYPPELIMARPPDGQSISFSYISNYNKKVPDMLKSYYNIKKSFLISEMDSDILKDDKLKGIEKEELRYKIYEKIDIYSLGLIMVHIFIKFTELQPDFSNMSINKGKYPHPFFEDFDKLIVSMTKNDFKLRSTPKEAYENMKEIVNKYKGKLSSGAVAYSGAVASSGSGSGSDLDSFPLSVSPSPIDSNKSGSYKSFKLGGKRKKSKKKSNKKKYTKSKKNKK